MAEQTNGLSDIVTSWAAHHSYKWGWPQNDNNPKKDDAFKNEDNLENQDDLKIQKYLKTKKT